MELPNEISNIICSYIESPTNQIIKDLYFDPIHCLKLNKNYNFKHLHIQRLLNAIHTECPHCWEKLKPHEFVYKGGYQIFFKKKLCFNCIEKETIRLCFEFSEMCLLLLIFPFIWFGILQMINAVEITINNQ